MLKYLIAAAIGLFTSPVACLMHGIYYYEFGISDVFLAGLYVFAVWLWCSKDGVYEQLKDYATRRKNNVHR